jgi:uncharacterized membrane protein
MAADAVLVRLERVVTTIEDHARRLAWLESTNPAVVAQEVRELRADLADVRNELRDFREELKANRKATYTVTLAVLGGAISFAFTAFTVWG